MNSETCHRNFDRLNLTLRSAKDCKLQKISLIRHGETLHNDNRLVSGQLDVSINNLGCEQAIELGESLGMVPSIVYCSGLIRTLETAALSLLSSDQLYKEKTCRLNMMKKKTSRELRQLILHDARYDLRIRQGFNERSFGGIEGQNLSALLSQNGTDILQSGAESYYSFAARVFHCFCEIIDMLLQDMSGKRVLIFCHAGVIRLMQSLLYQPTTIEEIVTSRVEHAKPIELSLKGLKIPVLFQCSDFEKYFDIEFVHKPYQE